MKQNHEIPERSVTTTIVATSFFTSQKPSICFPNMITVVFGRDWPFWLSHLFNRRSLQSSVTRCLNEQALLGKVRTSCKNNVFLHSNHSHLLQPHILRHTRLRVPWTSQSLSDVYVLWGVRVTCLYEIELSEMLWRIYLDRLDWSQSMFQDIMNWLVGDFFVD